MIPMIATKSLRYATRRLLPEDPFEAKNKRDARVLEAIGKARYATVDAQAGDEPADSSAAHLLGQANDMNFMAFKAAAAKILGDETPAKKADIIAALEQRAGISA